MNRGEEGTLTAADKLTLEMKCGIYEDPRRFIARCIGMGWIKLPGFKPTNNKPTNKQNDHEEHNHNNGD